MAEVAPLYREVRERITALVRDADVTAVVPPCPEWTVKDVVAHLSGVCADILAGRLEGVATDPWTARQVDERREWPIDRVLEEWADVGPRCEEISGAFGQAGVQWVADATTHEHDIRCALQQPGSRDSQPVAVAFTWLAEGLTSRPAFRILTFEGDDVVAGDGEPSSTVKVGRFEMFRALTGRRSVEQIAAFAWDGEPPPFSEVFNRGPFRMASSPIAE